MVYETMSKADIENTRQSFSKAMNSKAWKNSYGEMCKKTVLRRLCKLIDLDFNSEQIKAYEEGSLMDVKGTTLRESEVPIDVMSEEVIDADSKESDDGSCSE
jgi:recombination protein RecT